VLCVLALSGCASDVRSEDAGEPGSGWPPGAVAEYYGYCSALVGAFSRVPECECFVQRLTAHHPWNREARDADGLDRAAFATIAAACDLRGAKARLSGMAPAESSAPLGLLAAERRR
jgi:hypothetical protein